MLMQPHPRESQHSIVFRLLLSGKEEREKRKWEGESPLSEM